MDRIRRALKAEQKALAVAIREMKQQRTSVPYGRVDGLPGKQQDYRYQHVVYCLLRGRTMEEIEPKVRPGNELNTRLLGRIWRHYVGLDYPQKPEEVVDETTLCAREA